MINERLLKDIVGVGLVLSHVTTVGLIAAVYLLGGFLREDLPQLFASVVPPMAVYSTAIISYYISNKYRKLRGRSVSNIYAFFAVLFPLIYVLSLGVMILLTGFTRRLTVDDLVSATVVLESAFGIYAAKFVQSLFGELPSTTQSSDSED